jgi:hypothetical protein
MQSWQNEREDNAKFIKRQTWPSLGPFFAFIFLLLHSAIPAIDDIIEKPQIQLKRFHFGSFISLPGYNHAYQT